MAQYHVMVFALSRSSRTLIFASAGVVFLYAFSGKLPNESGLHLPDVKIWTSAASPQQAFVATSPKVRGFERAPPSCRVADLADDPLTLEYGQNNIRLSRTYEGSGTRVRKVLQKASDGEAIKIAIVGGSVSTVSGSCPRSASC